MIVLSQSLVLGPLPDGEQNNQPLIGYDNVVSIDSVTADYEDDDAPATNLANPATDLTWRSTVSTTQEIIISVSADQEFDYVGIASHNLGSAQAAVTIRGDSGSGLADLVEETLLPDDAPAIFRFDPTGLSELRVTLSDAIAIPEIAVSYLGKLSIVPRKLYVGHTPITYGGEPNIINGTSLGGKFLGTVIDGEVNRSSISLSNLDRDWVRENIAPMLVTRRPFFWSWRPYTFPKETGYVYMTGNPKPQNQRNNGMMSFSMNIEGEA